MSSATSVGTCHSVAVAVTYAPTAMKAALPMETWPARPWIQSRPSALTA